MTCREFRVLLRRPSADGWTGEARRHAEACASCAAVARASALLRLGSERDAGATPRPGFEERLRARLATGPVAVPRPAWNGGFDLLGRPALAVAATLLLLCAGWYVGTGGGRGDDLAFLVEADPVFTSVLGINPDAIFAEPQDAPAPEGAP